MMPSEAVSPACRSPAASAWPALLLCVALSAAAPATEVEPLPVQEISPGVWFHAGRHAAVGGPGQEDIANLGFIIGERCAAVIDSGGSVAVGRRLLAALRSVTDRPVCYLINTHIHFDHLLGNAAFRADGTEFVGHAELAPAVEENRTFFARRFPEQLGGLLPQEAVIGPGLLVRDTMELNLGGRPLYLKAWPAAHTHSDLTVLDRNSGVLWTGDLLFRERLPVLDGRLAGWLAALEAMPGPGVSLVVPGHGPPAQDWESAVAPQREYLSQLRDTVRGWLNQGLFLEQALERASAQPAGPWLLFEKVHRGNIGRVFVELEWE